jgi:hypothetical protein
LQVRVLLGEPKLRYKTRLIGFFERVVDGQCWAIDHDFVDQAACLCGNLGKPLGLPTSASC